MEGTKRTVIQVRMRDASEMFRELEGMVEIGDLLTDTPDGKVRVVQSNEAVIGVAMETAFPPWCLAIREEW